MRRNEFRKGLLNGIPVMLAYLFVSIGFGIMATSVNLTILEATLMSLTNLTSAGQYEGLTIIASAGSLLEMIICQIIINLRYSLMAVSLTQKLDDSFTPVHRLIVSFGITDEIFAIAYSKNEKLTPSYMYGLILTPILGWTAGTFIGALAGNILPLFITNALGILLFGMFISIIITPAKKDMKLLLCVIIAAALSVLFKFVLTFINTGIAIVVSAVLSALICALIFPVREESR